jgi:hypothetical protein
MTKDELEFRDRDHSVPVSFRFSDDDMSVHVDGEVGIAVLKRTEALELQRLLTKWLAVEPKAIISHDPSCPVSRPDFIPDVTPGHKSACTCDFGNRLAEEVGLSAEPSADARDAARYRWLRDTGAAFTTRATGDDGSKCKVLDIGRPCHGLDEAVDSAMNR